MRPNALLRVVMGMRPTHRNESHRFRHPRAKLALSLPKGGGPRPNELDSRFRGNDVTFDGAQRSGAKNLALDSSAEKQQGDPAVAGPQGGTRGTEQGRTASTRGFLAIFFALIGVFCTQKAVRFEALKTLSSLFSAESSVRSL